MKMHSVAYWLLVIGGLNWGLYAFGWDLQSWLNLGAGVYKVVYVVIGLAALYKVFMGKKMMMKDGMGM